MKKNNDVYSIFGKDYDKTRHADPEIVEYLYDCLFAVGKNYFLDIGCGSGNYTCALAAKGMKMVGIDISNAMLEKAKIKDSNIEWIHADAQNLPFDDHLFDGAISILSTHQFKDQTLAIHEAYRVIKNGCLVIFTTTPEQMRNYWLWHYFPKMMKQVSKPMMSFQDHKHLLEKAGFNHITAIPFFISNKLQDLFLYAGKNQPHMYLDPTVRAGILSFTKYCSPEEEQTGLNNLKQDIDSGKINNIITSYDNTEGDYLFIKAIKSD